MTSLKLTPEYCRTLVDPRWIGRRIAVAMSGGVDSTVAAAILAIAGCDVVGVTMKLWDFANVGGDSARDGRCCTVESFTQCRMVADRLGFPHYTLDLSHRFECDVIENFVAEYRAGRTPNPCVVCNSKIKWPALWDKVSAFGCEAIATGHYGNLTYGADKTVELHRAADPTRDQTYFLWEVPRTFLARTIFPLGSLLKTAVRELARSADLPNAETPESRDICFVSDGDVGRFLAERVQLDGATLTPGPIRDRSGTVIGEHKGIEAMTIGQRRGLGIAAGKPQYITRIDTADASVTLGDDADLFHRECMLHHVNWITDPPSDPIAVSVKIRYLHAAAPGTVTPLEHNQACLTFDTPQRAMTPGQSAVFYDGDRVLGGGLILSVGHP